MIFGLCSCSNVSSGEESGEEGNISFFEKDFNKKQDNTESQTPEPVSNQGSTVEEMIEKYHQDETRDIEAYLLLGIDRGGEAVDDGRYYGGGQSDGIYVIAMDNDSKKTTVLQINRDTYTDINVYDFFGNVLTTKKDRLALAYGMGSGMEDSCELAEAAISDFLHGLKFDGYVAIYYDAIAPVVDCTSGVSITIEDDMTKIDPVFVKGTTVQMDGEQAYLFCRARTSVGNQTNTGRMRRQRTFLNSFMDVCRSQIKVKPAVINDMYNAAEPYIVSNLSSGELCNIAVKALGYQDGGIVTPAGTDEWVTGIDGIRFCQFTVNDESLNSILCEVFNLQSL